MTRSLRLLIAGLAVSATGLATPCTAFGAATADPAPGTRGQVRMETALVTLRAEARLGAPSTGSAQRTVGRLQESARTSQAVVLDGLRNAVRRGEARIEKRLWITNSLVVTATPAVLADLAQRPDVASVVPDSVTVTPTALAPATANQAAVHAPDAWAAGVTGTGVVVAVLDSGVDASHPDLATRWRGGPQDWFDPYGQHPTTPLDLTGHGTGVTGIVLGGGDGGQTIGTAPGASWIAARIFDDSGHATLSAIHEAFQWALDPDGDPTTDDAPDVVNGSWALGSGPGCDLSLEADVEALRSAGILPVFAAGNVGPGDATSVSPANYPASVSVGSVGPDDAVSTFSSRGPSDCGGRSRPFPDLVAPGEGIPTADRWGLYQDLSGTSSAAPHVTGVLALALSAAPGVTGDQALAEVVGGARDLGPTGPDDQYGNGLLDAAAVVPAAPPAPALLLSTREADPVPGVPGTPDDADVYGWGTGGFVRSFDATANGLGARADVDALSWSGATSFRVSFAARTHVPGVGWVRDEDVVAFQDGSWSLVLDGSGHGLGRRGLDLDAISFRGSTLVFSTTGSVRVPGVVGRPDDADLYAFDGSRFRRVWDASRHGVRARADVDALQWTDRHHFSVSFAARTRVRGLGRVADEDVTTYANGTWTRLFDGSAHGLGAQGFDVDALSAG